MAPQLVLFITFIFYSKDAMIMNAEYRSIRITHHIFSTDNF